MTERERAIRRARPLWRLASSTSFEEESKTARRKAGYLMCRFGIRAEELEAPRVAVVPDPPPPVRRRAVVYAGWTWSTTSSGSFTVNLSGSGA